MRTGRFVSLSVVIAAIVAGPLAAQTFYGQPVPDLATIARTETHGPDVDIFKAVSDAYERHREHGDFIVDPDPADRRDRDDDWSDPGNMAEDINDISDEPLDPSEAADFENEYGKDPADYENAPDYTDPAEVPADLPKELPDGPKNDGGDDGHDDSDSDGSWEGGWDDTGNDGTVWGSLRTPAYQRVRVAITCLIRPIGDKR